MAQQTQFNVTNTKLVKLLKKTIKGIIAEQGIDPATRKGNKELDILVKQLAKQGFNSEIDAKNAAQKVGENIADLSKQQGKSHLDKGIVRQLSLQGIAQFSSQSASTTTTSKTETLPKQEAKPATVEKATPEAEETEEEPETTTVEKAVPEAEETEEEPETTAVEKAVPEAEETEEEPETTAVEKAVPEVEEPEATTVEKATPDVEKTEESNSTETAQSPSKGLKEKLTEDIKLAMKAKDKIRLETVRSLKKVLLEKEVEVRPKGQETLTPEQELEILAQQAKQRRDSIEQYRQGGRDDLADKESQELAIIETYLPAQLSEEEIGEIVDNIISSVGATSPKDMGKVMGPAMKELKGKADGKKVQEIVKSKLS